MDDRRYCAVCGENDPEVLEEHHVSGIANSPVTVTLCLNHHRKVTDIQNLFAPKFRSKNAPNAERLQFGLASLEALQKIVSEERIRILSEQSKLNIKGLCQR